MFWALEAGAIMMSKTLPLPSKSLRSCEGGRQGHEMRGGKCSKDAVGPTGGGPALDQGRTQLCWEAPQPLGGRRCLGRFHFGGSYYIKKC